MNRNIVKMILLLVCLLTVWPVFVTEAANFQKGIDAYKSNDYKTAFNEFKPLAIKGNVKAQYYLGTLYSTGKGLTKDHKEAIKWFTKAAEQKDAFSQFTLGQLYSQELKVYKDYVKAYAWYYLALSQGNETARKGRNSVMMKMTSDQVAEGKKFFKQIYNKIYGKK